MTRPRQIVLVAFPEVQSLDVVGPLEVFAIAERIAPGSYATEVVASRAEPFATSSGLTLTPHRSIAGRRGALDTIVVAGGSGVREAARDEALLGWLARAAGRSRRVASVCTGAFLLARAGLLEGRHATTHWASAELLAERHPGVTVEPDRIFVRDGSVWTSAGVTAGLDLALALVEDDLGREVALEVARWMVVFVRRPGGQSQFSAPLAAQAAERAPLREVQEWVRANPAADCSVEALATRACMSPRNFARAFRREVGVTPGGYVETIRVEAAKRLLEASPIGAAALAGECGFGTVETLRRAFRRRVGVSPGQYRDHFHTAMGEAA